MRITRRRFFVSTFIAVICWVTLISSVAAEFGPGNKNKSTKVVKAKTLAPLLKSPSEALWEKGLSLVSRESLESDDVVSAIVQFVKRESKAERFSPSLARAITILGDAAQPQAAEQLGAMLVARDYRVVMFICDAITSSATRDPALIEPLTKLAERSDYAEHYGFRRCVVDAVSRFREKPAIDFLLGQLESSDGQLKYEIAMSLQLATGQPFGGRATDWKKWWQEKRDSFEFPQTQSRSSVMLTAPMKEIAWEESRPNFYGMTVYAKRVVFVIDRSGSMRADIAGVSRLNRAQHEIQKAIAALSESDSFNVVAFNHQMDVFQPKLIPATASNKRDGIEFTFGLTPRGDTACYEPLKMALEASNDLELILFVSDGEPNSGALPDPTAIVTAITNHNLTQRTTIDSVGIDAHGVHLNFLRSLAEKNAGKLLVVK